MSSFFPYEDASLVEEKDIAAMNRILHNATTPGLVEFPDVSRILWCGEAVDHPFYLQAFDCVPKLFLSYDDIHALLSQVQNDNVEVTNTLNVVDVFQASCIDQLNERDAGKYFFGLVTNRAGGTHSIVSVPLSNSSENGGECSFDQQSTIALMRNLIKAIQYGKEFSLKSCFRIRAIGHSHHGYSQHNASDTYGKMTFEAICPNISFRATPIRTLPIVPSPLFSELVRANPRQMAPKMGYLTLNQARKLVPMLENDPSVSTTPLVGVWIRFGHLTSESLTDNCNLMKHPFSWGSCVRYLCHEAVQDRRFVDQETFVVVVIVAGVELEFYEVCRMVDIVEGVKRGPTPLTLRTEDFLCSDLTVDLSTNAQMTGDEYVVGQFRPRAPVSSMTRNRFEHKIRASADTAVPRSHPPSLARPRTAGISRYDEETVTPAPRRTPPSPLTYRSPSSLVPGGGSSSSSINTSQPLRSSSDYSSLRRSADRLPYPSAQAVDIISAQQRQIDLLTMEVQRLSQLIEHGQSKSVPVAASRPVAVDRSVDAPSISPVIHQIHPREVDLVLRGSTSSLSGKAKESVQCTSTSTNSSVPCQYSQDAVSITSSVAPAVSFQSHTIREEDDSCLSNVSEVSEVRATQRHLGLVSHDRLSSFGSGTRRPPTTSSSRTTATHISPESDSILAICAKYGKY